MTNRSEKPHVPYSDIPDDALRRIRPEFTEFDNPWEQDPDFLDKPWPIRLINTALLLTSSALVVGGVTAALVRLFT